MTSRTYFMLLQATSAWRALDADAQRAVFDDALMTVFNGFPGLRMSRYQVGALVGRCSHLIVWTLDSAGDTENANTGVDTFETALAALRQRPMLGRPLLFETVEVIGGTEDDEDVLLPIDAFAA